MAPCAGVRKATLKMPRNTTRSGPGASRIMLVLTGPGQKVCTDTSGDAPCPRSRRANSVFMVLSTSL